MKRKNFFTNSFCKCILILPLFAMLSLVCLTACGDNKNNSGNGNGNGNDDGVTANGAVVTLIDNYAVWNEVLEAEKYNVYLGTELYKTTTETALEISSTDFKNVTVDTVLKNGKTVKGQAAAYKPLKEESIVSVSTLSEFNKLDLLSKNSVVIDWSNLQTTNVSEWNLTIPKNVSSLHIKGKRGVTYTNFLLTISARITTIKLTLEDLNVMGKSNSLSVITKKSHDSDDSYIILNSIGTNNITASTGKNGYNGDIGDIFVHGTSGGAGEKGGTALSANNILVVGSGKISCMGGTGGNGGDGGYGNGLNKPGNGGNGGNGGDGITAENVIVFMQSGSSFMCIGGGGGTGGKYGSKELGLGSSERDGSTGNAGIKSTCEIIKKRGNVR